MPWANNKTEKMVLRDMFAFISIKKELIKLVKAKNLKNAV